jgi:4-amino-4-deoxy-L-arabinose transferase-like glycosyltransferase
MGHRGLADGYRSFQKQTLRLRIGILALVGLYAVGWGWGLPSEFPAAEDAPVPLSPLAFIAAYDNPHIAHKYPAAHQLFLLGPYAAAISVFALSGNLEVLSSQWPYGFKYPVSAFSWLIVVSSVVSTLMAVGVLLTLRRITLSGPRKGAPLPAILLLAGSGVFTYYARAGTFDVPYLFWWSLSVCLLWKYFQTDMRGGRYLLGAAACSALAVATKDQAAGLIVGSVLAISLVGRKSAQVWRERLAEASLFSAVSLGMYLIVAVLPQPFRWVEHIKLWLPGARGITDYVQYDHSLGGQLGLAGRTLSCIWHVLSPAGSLLALIGLAILLIAGSRRQVAILMLPVLTYYGLIIVPIGFVYERFVLPIAYVLVIFAGVGLMEVWRAARARTAFWKALAGGTVGLTIGLQWMLGFLSVTYVQLFDSKRALARELPAYAPKGAAVLWYGPVSSLPNAGIYQDYRLMLSQGRSPEFAGLRHALHPYDEAWTFALAETPAMNKSLVTLVRAWKYPEWVKAFIHVPCAKEYYLFRRITPSRTPEAAGPS